jgi:hypothetical protein
MVCCKFSFFVVCVLERATTTRDVIYAVSWSVRQLTRELERQPTSQRVNVRTAPLSWPLGECHGVTCSFCVPCIVLYSILWTAKYCILRVPAMSAPGLDEAWRRVSTRPARRNCELETASAASSQSVSCHVRELELRRSYRSFFIAFT